MVRSWSKEWENKKGGKGAGLSAVPSVLGLGRNRRREEKEGAFNKGRVRDDPWQGFGGPAGGNEGLVASAKQSTCRNGGWKDGGDPARLKLERERRNPVPGT